MTKKDFYIYNFDQANFFINNGILVVKVGKGKKGDAYIKFLRNDDSEKVFTKWCELCNALKGIA